MSKLPVNATLDKATPKIERYARLAGDLAVVQGNRDAALSRTNAVADELAKPILDEMARIAAELEPWWKRIAPTLLKGKRKSIELAGCVIGTRSSKAKLLTCSISAGVIARIGNDPRRGNTSFSNRCRIWAA